MTPNERLLAAAKRVKVYLEARIRCEYYEPNEDVFAGRELADAIREVEAERKRSAA